MVDTLGRGASKLQQFLHDAGYAAEVQELPQSTRTAKEAAAAIGCELGQIAKSLALHDVNSGVWVLAIVAGDEQADIAKLDADTGLTLALADPKTIKRELGFPIGGVPPVGHAQKLTTLLDRSLQRFDRVWAAAGSPNAVVGLAVSKLEAMTTGRWFDLTS